MDEYQINKYQVNKYQKYGNELYQIFEHCQVDIEHHKFVCFFVYKQVVKPVSQFVYAW
jgi:hypothetical protein